MVLLVYDVITLETIELSIVPDTVMGDPPELSETLPLMVTEPV